MSILTNDPDHADAWTPRRRSQAPRRLRRLEYATRAVSAAACVSIITVLLVLGANR